MKVMMPDKAYSSVKKTSVKTRGCEADEDRIVHLSHARSFLKCARRIRLGEVLHDTTSHVRRSKATGGGCRWKHLPLLLPGILLTKAHSASYSGLARRLSLSLRCCAAWKVRMVMKHVQARISNGVNEFFMKGARSLQIHFTGAPEKWK